MMRARSWTGASSNASKPVRVRSGWSLRTCGLTLASALLASSLGGGCGPELDPIHKLNNTRIIGVRKSSPYAYPGERITLKMLWEDGAEDGPRDVQVFFGFWCTNPPGDLYYQCFGDLEGGTPSFEFGSDEFVVDIPEDIVRPASDPNFPPYGTAFVFYGACAGELQIAGIPIAPGSGGAGGASGGGTEIPENMLDSVDASLLVPACVDEEGNTLGADDYVFGYSTIFVYEDLKNRNPLITGFEQDGKPVDFECIDEDCDGPMEIPELDGCQDGVVCIDRCEDDADPETCPEVKLSAIVDPDSVDPDEISREAYGRELDESMWVSYFVDRGSITDVRLVNDATDGFQEDISGTFYAPKDPGPIRIWAAARDNRGGISWIRLPGYVR